METIAIVDFAAMLLFASLAAESYAFGGVIPARGKKKRIGIKR